MKRIENQTFDMECALYGQSELLVKIVPLTGRQTAKVHGKNAVMCGFITVTLFLRNLAGLSRESVWRTAWQSVNIL